MKKQEESYELTEQEIKAAISYWLGFHHDVVDCEVELKVERRAPSISDNLGNLEEVEVFSAVAVKK